MRGNYGDETWNVFSALTHRNLQVAEENGHLQLRISEEDFEFQMRKYNQIVDHLLAQVRRPYEKNKELAQRLHVNQTVLSAAASEKNSRKLKRDVILSALFSLSPIPTVDQVNHKLMELMEPGLFTETAYIVENRRNWVIYHVLEYAQAQACPLDNWLDYVNAVLETLGMEPLICTGNGGKLPAAHLDMLAQWRRVLDGIGYVDFSILRKKLLADYRLANGLDHHGGRKAAFKKVSNESGVDISMVESIFGTMSNRNSNVHPETLIPVMAVMGCTLLQANEMLLQANRALVYHTSRSKYDLQWIRRLMQNSIPD